MDGNRDEAHRCIEIAERAAFIEKKYEKAKKFLLKAEKLYPSQKAKELMLEVAKHAETSQTTADREPSRKKQEQDKENTVPSPESEFGRKELDAIRRIKKCKDYYEILEINKEATDSDIKKAYKKLALQLHPDKNNAPGAAEAFKAIGNAVAILTDKEKRKQYNAYIVEEARVQGSRNHSDFNHSRGFESDMTADEMFNMFFGGGFPHRRTRRWTRQGEPGDRQSGYTSFIHMLPIILLIMISMMSSFFISDPIYNLHPTQKFSVLRKTQNLKVPYYVKENFHLEYRGSSKRLEASVEEQYVNNMRSACHREKNYKESMTWKAQYFGDAELYDKSQTMKMPSCDILNNLQNGNFYIPS